MTQKQDIINRILSLLRPRGEVLCTYFLQDEKRPGIWMRQGVTFTREEADAVKARRKFFISVARRKTGPHFNKKKI